MSKIIPLKEINRKRLELLLTKDFNYDSIVERVNDKLINGTEDPVWIRNYDIKKMLKANDYVNVDKFPVHIIMNQLVFDIKEAGYKARLDMTKYFDIDHNMDIVASTIIIELREGGKS